MPSAQSPFGPASLRSGILILVWLCSVATAQQPGAPGQLPCALAAKQVLEPGDEQTIRQFITSQTPGLTDANPEATSKSRDALMSPLSCDGITFAFRSKYADLLTPALTPLAAAKDERHAVNALLMLGRLRTTSSADALAGSLKSGNPVIRFAASSGYRELLSQLAKDAFGFPDGAIDRVLDGVAAALRIETDPLTADIMAVTLGDATKASAPLRSRAMLRLADAMAHRLISLRKEAAVDPTWSRTVLRTLDLARQAMLEQGGAGAIDKEFAKRAALLSGHVFAYARDRLGATMAAADTNLSKAIVAAEGLAVIAHQAATGQRINEKGLQKAFDASFAAGDAKAFTDAVQSWIDPEGLLTKAPYNAAAADFAPAN